MEQYHTYIIIFIFIAYFLYQIFKFVKRKIRWMIFSIPMLATVGGANLPQGKLQQFLALFY